VGGLVLRYSISVLVNEIYDDHDCTKPVLLTLPLYMHILRWVSGSHRDLFLAESTPTVKSKPTEFHALEMLKY
jgi:hypothetical protein